MARNGRGHFRSDHSPREPRARCGMTLIELLIVVFILSLLLATALPLMAPAIEEGKIRDAARQINAFLAGAKARAAEIGRPVGVWIERTELERNASVQLYLAETPPIYSGDSLGATATVTVAGGSFVTFVNSESLPFIVPLVGQRFRIKFGYKGQYYGCTRAGTLAAPVFVLDAADVARVSPIDDKALPFQILLKPRRSMAAPLQLPGGAAIDLRYSGIGGVTDKFNGSSVDNNPPAGLEFRDNLVMPGDDPVIIDFRTSGDVERLEYMYKDPIDNKWKLKSFAPTGTIHLLVGKFEQVGTDAENSSDTPNPINWSASDTTMYTHNENIVDGRSFWISIGHRTGLVTSSKNGWSFGSANFFDGFRAAREFGQKAQMAGGR